jgi:hypothetical protein
MCRGVLKIGDLQGTIRGIVHASGLHVYAGSSFWMRRIFFHMHFWRLDGQLVQTKRLLVTLEVSVVMMPLWRRRLAPGATISFVTTGIERIDSRVLQVPMDSFLGAADDPELLEVQASRRKPDILETAEFGRLALDPGGMDYIGQCVWYGRTIELELGGDDEGSVEVTLRHARTLLATWPEWLRGLRELVARELLPLWLDWHDGEPPIDGDTLYWRLTLQRIWVMDDGGVQLVMDAGSEFDNDDLKVEGTVAGGPTEIVPEG